MHSSLDAATDAESVEPQIFAPFPDSASFTDAPSSVPLTVAAAVPLSSDSPIAPAAADVMFVVCAPTAAPSSAASEHVDGTCTASVFSTPHATASATGLPVDGIAANGDCAFLRVTATDISASPRVSRTSVSPAPAEARHQRRLKHVYDSADVRDGDRILDLDRERAREPRSREVDSEPSSPEFPLTRHVGGDVSGAQKEDYFGFGKDERELPEAARVDHPPYSRGVLEPLQYTPTASAASASASAGARSASSPANVPSSPAASTADSRRDRARKSFQATHSHSHSRSHPKRLSSAAQLTLPQPQAQPQQHFTHLHGHSTSVAGPPHPHLPPARSRSRRHDLEGGDPTGLHDRDRQDQRERGRERSGDREDVSYSSEKSEPEFSAPEDAAVDSDRAARERDSTRRRDRERASREPSEAEWDSSDHKERVSRHQQPRGNAPPGLGGQQSATKAEVLSESGGQVQGLGASANVRSHPTHRISTSDLPSRVSHFPRASRRHSSKTVVGVRPDDFDLLGHRRRSRERDERAWEGRENGPAAGKSSRYSYAHGLPQLHPLPQSLPAASTSAQLRRGHQRVRSRSGARSYRHQSVMDVPSASLSTGASLGLHSTNVEHIVENLNMLFGADDDGDTGYHSDEVEELQHLRSSYLAEITQVGAVLCNAVSLHPAVATLFLANECIEWHDQAQQALLHEEADIRRIEEELLRRKMDLTQTKADLANRTLQFYAAKESMKLRFRQRRLQMEERNSSQRSHPAHPHSHTHTHTDAAAQRESRDSRDARDFRDVRDTRETRNDVRDSRDSRERDREVRDREPRGKDKEEQAGKLPRRMGGLGGSAAGALSDAASVEFEEADVACPDYSDRQSQLQSQSGSDER